MDHQNLKIGNLLHELERRDYAISIMFKPVKKISEKLGGPGGMKAIKMEKFELSVYFRRARTS